MRYFLIVLIAFTNSFQSGAQFTQELKDNYNDGQYFLNRGDYKEALFYFKKMVDSDPENANFNFKLGICYMNVPGSESLAVSCFEKAVKHIVPKKKYDRKDILEKHAPLYAWFYLGNVYRITNRLDEALKAYNVFISSPYYYGDYNESIVENEVKACERAKIIQDNPISFTEELLDTAVNTTASEIDPVISPDEQTLVFVRRLKFYDAIYMSEKKNGSWGNPVNINPLVGSDGDQYPVALSADGNELYLVKNDDNQDICVSFREGGTWSKAVALNSKVNSSADEASASISSDGKYLYFSSERKGGYGGFDLYVSQREGKLQWGKARNLGSVINTPFDENNPSITNADTTLFFSSKGHFSMGGYDIFYASRSGKKWNEPVNIGFPLNNTSDNTGFEVLPGGKSGYLSKSGHGLAGQEPDICKIMIK